VIEHQTYKFSVFLEHQGFAMNSLVCEALNSIANDALMSLIHTFDTMVELLQTTPQINAQEKTPIPLYCGASICAFKPLVKVFKA
jgi:hypothetical protein